MEIPKYSDWLKKVSEKPEIEIDSESFRALFNKRDEKTPNWQMHNFLKAYAFAVNKTKKQYRFPNLDEIENAFAEVNVKVRGQVVYNLKLRIMQNTQFFDEIDFGTKGVYLLPKALKYRDRSGKYSDLIFDFENGAVILPELNPTALKVAGQTESVISVITENIEDSIDGSKKSSENTSLKIKKSVHYKYFIFGLIAIILIALVFLITALNNPLIDKKSVMYSINASNDEDGDFILFELSNPSGIDINSTLVIPSDRVIVEVGTVSIIQSNNTTIGLNTESDARVKMYVQSYESVPLVLTHNYDGDPIPTVSGINNYNQKITPEKFQWNFEIRKDTSIKIWIEQ